MGWLKNATGLADSSSVLAKYGNQLHRKRQKCLATLYTLQVTTSQTRFNNHLQNVVVFSTKFRVALKKKNKRKRGLLNMLAPDYDYKASFAHLAKNCSVKDYVPYLKLLITYFKEGLLEPHDTRLSKEHKTFVCIGILGVQIRGTVMNAKWIMATREDYELMDEYLTGFLRLLMSWMQVGWFCSELQALLDSFSDDMIYRGESILQKWN